MRVHAVERGVRRMGFVEVRQQVVDKMREWFGNDHGIRQWYNKLSATECRARCTWSRRRSATSRTSRRGRCASWERSRLIAAEDTRRTAHLLARYAIHTPDDEPSRAQRNARRRRRSSTACWPGENVALVSDAGTPLISDPGRHLIRAAVDAGITDRAHSGAECRNDGARCRRGFHGHLHFPRISSN